MLKKRIFGVSPWLLLLIPVIVVAAWAARENATTNQTVQLTTLDEVADHANLRFPPGAKLTYGEWRHAQNSFGYARVELPPDQVTEFLKQPMFGGLIERRKEPAESLDHVNVGRIPHDRALIARWNLLAIRNAYSAAGGDLTAGNHFPVDAFVDMDHPDHPILYLHWYD